TRGPRGSALKSPPPPRRKFLPVEREILAVDARGLFGRHIENEHSPVPFDARQLDGLAGFLGDGAGEFLPAFGNGLGNAAQHALPLEGRQAASGTEGFDGGGDCSFSVLAPCLSHSPNYAAVEGAADLDDVAVFHPTAVDKKTVGCDWGDRH